MMEFINNNWHVIWGIAMYVFGHLVGYYSGRKYGEKNGKTITFTIHLCDGSEDLKDVLQRGEPDETD